MIQYSHNKCAMCVSMLINCSLYTHKIKERMVNMTIEMAAALEQLETVAKTRAAKISNKRYSVQVGTITKMAPQAVVCIKAIVGVDKEIITEQEIHDAIEESELVTKQEKWSIYKYYKKMIMDAGFLTEIK